eukprot:TRINITY_DN4646_c0_g1_i5.p1 TRINITY_DN4646_c0_g1~~TRINITY_DN4646_c0_g1_i5.p1  ORF type:complete len:135 (-),score=8.61 TRINITY_DN4646_c0_g1_i5:36-440(-)
MRYYREFYLQAKDAVRIVYQKVDEIATRFSLKITPVFSIYDELYPRIFLKVNKVKDYNAASTLLNKASVLRCTTCPNFKVVEWNSQKDDNHSFTYHLKDNCEQCGSSWILNGPIWKGPLSVSYTHLTLPTIYSV